MDKQAFIAEFNEKFDAKASPRDKSRRSYESSRAAAAEHAWKESTDPLAALISRAKAAGGTPWVVDGVCKRVYFNDFPLDEGRTIATVWIDCETGDFLTHSEPAAAAINAVKTLVG